MSAPFRILLIVLAASALHARGGEPVKDALTSLPLAKGLPLVVRAGVAFVDVAAVEENAGAYVATVDLRLRWQDFRLGYPAAEAPGGFKEYRGPEAEARRAEIWTPEIVFENLIGEPAGQSRGLRIEPNGSVELMQRLTGKFASEFEVENFPFDRQKLVVRLLSRRDNGDRVALDFRQSELNFSRVAKNVSPGDWTTGLVDIRRQTMPGWHGETHARLEVAPEIARRPGNTIATIFIPILATLLIPMLSIWMNKSEGALFQIEAFELANVIIGGLFAVIALNFPVNSTYPTLASGDNTVARLFGLNYLALGVALLISVLLFRFNLVQRLFGKYVQEQLYFFLVWAVPVLTLMMAGALLLVAKAG